MVKQATQSIISVTLLALLASCDGFEAADSQENAIVYIRSGVAVARQPSSVDEIPPIQLPTIEGLAGLTIPEPVMNADTTVQPHRSVGRMNVFRSGSAGHCTATLIENTRVIATAAHCLYNSVDGWIEDIEFDLRSGGDSPQNYGWRCAALNRRWIDSRPDDTEITLGQVAVDIAFVLLDGPTASPLTLSDARSADVSISGYPGKHNAGRIMVTGTVPATQISNGILRAFIDHGAGASGSGYISGNDLLGVLSGGNGSGLHVGAPVNSFAQEIHDFVSNDCPADQGIAADDLAALDTDPTPNLFHLPFRNDVTIERVQFVPNPEQLDCRFVCSSISPLCDVVQPPFGLNDELQDFSRLVMEQREIQPAEIMQIFGISEDQCGRSSLLIESGRFENTGTTNSCYATISETVQDGGAEIDLDLVVSLPSTISGTIEFAGDELDARFEAGESPVSLFNRDPSSIFSGDIRRVSVDGTLLVAELGGSCVMMDLE
jgi:V8-like Glu-specific endopeptidase